jgi:hypothetical protein
MVFSGGVVGVEVGGTCVGVSAVGTRVGEEGVDEFDRLDVGTPVVGIGVPGVAQPARAAILTHTKNINDNFRNIYTSFYPCLMNYCHQAITWPDNHKELQGLWLIEPCGYPASSGIYLA